MSTIRFIQKHKRLSVFLLLLIITIPAFLTLLNSMFFTMHDDQHIARLYLLDQGIRQGSLYPRWVDVLGFGYGYPLFNFYPPLIYFVAEIFHVFGVSYIWSIKLVVITGFVIGSWGMYLFANKFIGKKAAFVSTVLYTFFTYRALLVYVRGALAEFFAMSLLPFVFLAFYNLYRKQKTSNTVLFGIVLALLILAHPLIAFPSMLFILFFSIFFLFQTSSKLQFIKHAMLAGLTGLSLSTFFWLPSILERKYTLVDNILLTELADYKIHFVYPQQFWYSPWGFGGSIEGPFDGLSFQLGKLYIGLVLLSIFLSLFYLASLRANKMSAGILSKAFHRLLKCLTPGDNAIQSLRFYYFFLFLLFFSLFMTTSFSSPIWDNVRYLSYLQFPWRFLTFAAIFFAITGGYSIFFLNELLQKQKLSRLKLLSRQFILLISALTIIVTIGIYQKYFKPQKLLPVTDSELTSYEEIAWRVSRTSFEFLPKGVETVKSKFDTTIPSITQADIAKKPYEIIRGLVEVDTIKNDYDEKIFSLVAQTPVEFRLNTFNFPGWKAYIEGLPRGGRMDSSGVAHQTQIDDSNANKLITVNVPQGTHTLFFRFESTLARRISSWLSTATLFLLGIYWLVRLKK